MNRNLITLALAAFGIVLPRKLGRHRTCDVSYIYRMPAGFAGDVNRSHPASIEPCLVDSGDPPQSYGIPVLVDSVTQGVRQFVAGDQSDTVAAGYGMTVRPFPTQQATATDYGAISLTGAVVPAASQPIDILRSGYIMVKVNVGTAVKGAPVYVWCSASAGAHVQGGIEATFDAGDTTQLLNATFNGGADANGIAEIVFNA